ncbi:MAG TPA: hypothetical protein VK828_20260 [Terriglobales bacterium]|nr:hypothetical protein [Terriglobales bacterium]
MQSKGSDEIAGLKLPFGEGTIDDLESDGQPIGGGKGRAGLGRVGGNLLS